MRTIATTLFLILSLSAFGKPVGIKILEANATDTNGIYRRSRAFKVPNAQVYEHVHTATPPLAPCYAVLFDNGWLYVFEGNSLVGMAGPYFTTSKKPIMVIDFKYPVSN